MAVFSKNVELTHDQDFLLLQNYPINKYYSNKILQSHMQWLLEHQYVKYEFDCLKYNDTEVFFKDIQTKLHFPGYDNMHLDGFRACLSDFDVDEKVGTFFIFYHFDAFYRMFPDFSWKILDILAESTRYNLLFGRRLIIILQVDDPQFSIEQSVGAFHIGWNYAEWAQKDRPVDNGQSAFKQIKKFIFLTLYGKS